MMHLSLTKDYNCYLNKENTYNLQVPGDNYTVFGTCEDL